MSVPVESKSRDVSEDEVESGSRMAVAMEMVEGLGPQAKLVRSP